MDNDKTLINSLLDVYQHKTTVVEHPTFPQGFSRVYEAMPDRIPFHCVEKGQCTVTCEGEDFELKQGDFIALMRGSKHQVTIPDNESSTASVLVCGYFEFLSNKSQLLTDGFPITQVVRASDIACSKKLKSTMQLLILELNTEELANKQAINALADYMFISLIRMSITSYKSKKGVLAAFADPQLAKALQAFHEAFDEHWTLGRLAQEAGMSRTRFALRFRHLVGVSPGLYIAQWRLNWAARQITETDISLNQIAFSSGYHSNASFSRAFKKTLGVSPSDYRRSFNSSRSSL